MSSADTKQSPVKRREVLGAAAGAGLFLLAAGKTKKAEAAYGKAKGAKWGMLVDLRRCIGCKTCSVACKAENEVPLGAVRTAVHYLDKGTYPNAKRYFAKTACNHCDNPPCVEACPVDPVKAKYKRPDGVEVGYEKKATYKRPDGTVLVDYDRCVGCHMCVAKCPYGARYVDPNRKAGANPSSNTVGKCTLCAHRVDQGVEPSCVQGCVGGALTFGNLNNPASKIARLIGKEKVSTWKPGEGTGPNTYYIGLKDKAVLGKEVHSL